MPSPKKKIADREADLRSLCRGYTKVSIQKLGGYVVAETGVEDDIRLRAIGMLLDRGWGKPNQDNTHLHEVKGEIRVVLRKMLDDDDG